jgi:hypothetical protein
LRISHALIASSARRPDRLVVTLHSERIAAVEYAERNTRPAAVE